jgi:hypothetical protein
MARVAPGARMLARSEVSRLPEPLQKNANNRAGVALAAARRAPGRLDPELHDVDVRLQRWGEYARHHYAARGFPVFAGDRQPAAVQAADRSLWLAEVVETDEAVVRLTWQLATAVMAHYFTDGASAERLLIYRQLVRHIESVRQSGKLPVPTLAMFRNSLDRARWSLRYALTVKGILQR